MSSTYTRILIPIISTTLLHASIFYTLSEIEEVKTITPKIIEIALFDAPAMEKKEEIQTKQETKPKVQEKPKEEPKPKEPPKKVVVKEPLKPKPIKTPEKVIEPVEVAAPIQELSAEAPTEQLVQAKTLHERTIEDDVLAQKASKEQKATSTVAPDILEAYLYKVRQKIQKNLRYPPLAKRLKIEGEAVVAFTILENGGVVEASISIKKTSGHKSLDHEAIETILSVAPFEAPPSAEMQIIVPVAFNLR